MKTVGTCVGQTKYQNEQYMQVSIADDNKPRFKLFELLDKYQIKGYMGKSHKDLVDLYNKALVKEASQLHDEAIDAADDE
jgi:hypothetical protein